MPHHTNINNVKSWGKHTNSEGVITEFHYEVHPSYLLAKWKWFLGKKYLVKHAFTLKRGSWVSDLTGELAGFKEEYLIQQLITLDKRYFKVDSNGQSWTGVAEDKLD